MATFVTTTLAKRSTAANATFEPSTRETYSGLLVETGAAFTNYAATIDVSSRRTGGNLRRTKVTFQVPQLNADKSAVIRYARATLEVLVPDGVPNSVIDDLIGYVNAATAKTKTNLDQILVGGVGVF